MCSSDLFGAGQPREAVADGINYITLGLLIGLAVGAVMWWFAPTFVGWVGVDDPALPHAIDWLRGAALGSPAMMATFATVGLFRGLQDTRVTFYVTIFQVTLNMLLCAYFVFGTDLGTLGAGIAVTIAESIGFLTFLVVLLRYEIGRAHV